MSPGYAGTSVALDCGLDQAYCSMSYMLTDGSESLVHFHRELVREAAKDGLSIRPTGSEENHKRALDVHLFQAMTTKRSM